MDPSSHLNSIHIKEVSDWLCDRAYSLFSPRFSLKFQFLEYFLNEITAKVPTLRCAQSCWGWMRPLSGPGKFAKSLRLKANITGSRLNHPINAFRGTGTSSPA